MLDTTPASGKGSGARGRKESTPANQQLGNVQPKNLTNGILPSPVRLLSNLFAVAALLFSTPINAAPDEKEWAHIDTDDSGMKIYARQADLLAGRSTQSAAKVWIWFDASRDRSVNWREARVLYVVNCVAQTYRSVQWTFYYANGRNVVDETVSTSRFITPGTRMEDITNLLCSDPNPPADYR